ncbi:MAG: M24 family metallopeptidase [Erysipelotrichaceae bacterium]
MKIILKKIEAPKVDETCQVILTDETMRERKGKVLKLKKEANLDYLVVYSDLEDGSNFEYLTGFLTRFEEGLLVIGPEKNYLITGNENVDKASISRIEVEGILYSPFSLPDQPDMSNKSLTDIFIDIGMKNKRIGVCGWKKIEKGFDLPSFVIDSLREVSEDLVNATALFIDPEKGARITNNANEIAHYYYGASLASKGILLAMEKIKVGMKEKELAQYLNNEGQRGSVITICATGKRFENANIYPSEKEIRKGDIISLTVGYKGGLQSRCCFVADSIDDVSENNKGYLEKLAIPYFKAIVSWLEKVKVGISGGEMFDLAEELLPSNIYNRKLNPGHLIADEEWLASPIYKNSEILLQSGMLIQFDILTSLTGMSGVSVEGGIALADEKLQQEIKQQYPELYSKFMETRKYMIETLGIDLHPDVLPMGNASGYFKPFLLTDEALVKER